MRNQISLLNKNFQVSRIPIANNDLIIETPENEENRISAEVKGDFNNPLNLPLNNYSPQASLSEDETAQDINVLRNNNIDSETIPITPGQNEANFRGIFPSNEKSNEKSNKKTPKQLNPPNKMPLEEVINEIMERENSNDDLRRQELGNMGKRELNKILTDHRNEKIDHYFTPKKRMTFK